MLKLQLPSLKLDIPYWQPRELALWDRKTEVLREKSDPENIEVSGGIKERAKELYHAVTGGADLAWELRRGKDIRALIWLWLEYESVYQRLLPGTRIFKRFEEVKPKLSKLALYDLTLFYLQYFDDINGFDALCDFLKRQFQKQTFSGTDSDLAKIQHFREIIFNPSGPEFLAEDAESCNKPLNTVLREVGLPDGRAGKFYQACTNYYYLNRVRVLWKNPRK